MTRNREQLLHRKRRRRLELVRYADVYASPTVLRRRDLRVLNLRRWLVIYTPRDHWSNHL